MLYKKENGESLPKDMAFNKKINRMLYKLNDGILQTESPEYQEYYQKRQRGENVEGIDAPENVTDITHAFLISLEAMIALLKSKGITNIVVPKSLPLRQKVETRFDYEKATRIKENVTKKFVRTFKRMSKHFSEYNYEENEDYLLYDTNSKGEREIVENPILSNIDRICRGRFILSDEELSKMSLEEKERYLYWLERKAEETKLEMDKAKFEYMDSDAGVMKVGD